MSRWSRVVLVLCLVAAGCSEAPRDYRLDDPPGPADSAILTLGDDSSGVVELAGRAVTTLPAVYAGSGAGSVEFDPSGRYVAIYGEPEPNGFPDSTSLLDFTTGDAVKLPQPERCGGGPILEFATDSRTLVEADCERVRPRVRYDPGRCGSSCGVTLVGTGPRMIAWTVQGSDSGAELWTLDAAGTATRQAATTDGRLTFVGARLLRPGPDFLRTPHLRR